jgi:hypothetical protein
MNIPSIVDLNQVDVMGYAKKLKIDLPPLRALKGPY